MNIRILREDGSEAVIGRAVLSPSRGKPAVQVVFEREQFVNYPGAKIDGYLTKSEEFYLEKFERAICVWGQGSEYPNHNLSLHPDDAAEIVKGGGG